MPAIFLTTLNAQYIHASLGLRYLLANLGELRERAVLREYIIDQRPIDIVEKILAEEPAIVGLGVYIWNVTACEEVVALLKQVRPDVMVVLGGPEVSYECEQQRIVQLADYVISGQGDVAFADLCRRVLAGERPAEKIIRAEVPTLEQLEMPYRYYSDDDIAKRLIYVEASRGCPFKCEFCLSSLDKTAWPFALERFLAEMQTLYQRGARHFKFVDRTFNLNVKASQRILDFFLERMTPDLFVHFEIIPDHLPEALKETIARFPPGALQFEIGIQTLNPDVQANISRKQDDGKTAANLRWIREHSHAHIHADLIIGLPGESLDSFARGFNRLVALDPHEVQVGILKRLRGTTLDRHTQAFGMRYNPQPPYNILANDLLDFATMQRLSRFARYWGMIANSGRYVHAKSLLLGDDPFARFLRFSDWLYATTGQTHRFAQDRLFDFVFEGMTQSLGVDAEAARAALTRDYHECGARGAPKFLSAGSRAPRKSPSSLSSSTRRQALHRRD